jgi:predicted nuclease with TOPRIM domain
MCVSDKKVEDFIKEPELIKFFMEDIDDLLKMYEPGRPENKPDVIKQLDEIQKQREEMIIEHERKQHEYQDTINKVNQMYSLNQNQNQDQMTVIIQELTMENKLLKDKVKYLEDKIRQIIKDQIEKSKQSK